MSDSPQTLRYVFYGGAEGYLQNYEGEDAPPAAPQPGAGYTQGQLITGYLALSGEALAIANSVPRGTQFSLQPGQSGLDFFFEHPMHGTHGGFTEEQISQPVEITLGAADAPLSNLRAVVGDSQSFEIISAFSTDLSGPPDDEISVDGVWLPETIKPLTLSGTDSNDTLRGTATYNFLSGGAGNDTLFLKTGQGWIWGGLGDDYIKGGSKADNLFGGYGNDKILGRDGNDLIRGGDGNDELRGEQGKDTIVGGYGNDTVKGGSGSDELYGQAGNDRIEGNDGNDMVHTGLGNDYASGGSGDDWIFSEGGSDTMTGGSGHDIFFFNINYHGGFSVITDFKHGQDHIAFKSAVFETYEELRAHMAQVGHDTVITWGTGNNAATVTLEHTKMAELRASDFFLSVPG